MGQHFSCKKGVCDQCEALRYCNAPTYCQSKIHHKQFGIHIQSDIEQRKIKLNRTTIYRETDRMNLIYELDLCDDGKKLSNKDKWLKISNLLGVESKTCNEIPNKVWDMADRGMEGRKLMRHK